MQDVPSQPDQNEKLSEDPQITLDDIDSSVTSVQPTSSDVPVRFHELNAAFVRVTEENSALKEENEALKSNAKTVDILNDMMKPSANKAFCYMFAYSGTVGLMLILNAFGCFKVPLDVEVMKFLVGSTAVTVIGLVGMVLTGLFIGARRN